MNHKLSSEDKTFKNEFEACKVDPADFDHRAHIRMAYIYLCENESDTAYQKMRDSLHALLTHLGVDPASKYHETITRAWILAVKHFMVNDTPATSADDFISNNPKLLDRKIMLTHYSSEVLFSDAAKQTFIEPNLTAIPLHV